MHYVRLSAGTLIFLLISGAGFAQSIQLADSLNQRGLEYYKSGNYRQAEFYLREAFQLYQKQTEPAVWLSPGMDYAEILVDRSKYDQALTLFKRLKKVAVNQKNIQAQARIENDLGWAYKKKGEAETALDYYQRAIPLAKEAKDTLRLGYIYNNIGLIYRGWGNYKASLEYYQQALSYKKKTNRKKSIAITLNNIGLSYIEISLYDKALEYYKQSLAIRKQLGNIDLLATATSNIGSLYKQLGSFDQALVYYQQSLEYARKAGNPVKTAQTLNNIGTLYSALGQPNQELAYYQQSLQLKKQYANAASLAVTYSNIAGSYRENDQPEQALAYYQQALALRKQAGNPREVAASLLELAQFEKNRQQFENAYGYINQARSIADSTNDRSLLHETASLQGDLKFAVDNYTSAISHYKKALEYSHTLGKTERIRPLKGLAYTYHQLNSDSALHYGQEAIDLVEILRSQTGTLSRFKSGFFKRHTDFYKTMASWTLKYTDDVEEAFRLIESAKARALTDELAKAAQRIDESLPEEERVTRAQQLAEISNLYSQLESTTDSDKEQALKQKIRNKELAYASFEQRLKQQYEYKQLESPEPIPLSKAQELTGTETAIMEYALTDGKLLIFLITSNEAKTAQINLSKNTATDSSKVLRNQIYAFREAITSRATEDSIRTLSRPLYEQLVAPFKEELRAYKNLIIIPDDILAYLPFEAIYHNNYLVSQFNIKYVPSMTGFSLIQKPSNASTASILAIGNANRYASSGAAPMLPSVDYEIKSITNLFDTSVTMADQGVTETAVKQRVQNSYPFIHIAAHSVIDERNSSQSGIILGDGTGEDGIGNDGYLRSSEIYRLNINSAMVVLSACKSGMGDLISGEGLLGLQRAFFNAGTSTVVVSLWDVYDRPTTRFMKRFYSLLMEKNERFSWSGSWQSFLRWTGWDQSVPFGSPAAAMREAKLAMLEHPEYRHPVYWAPFIVVGR
ncbi:MAG: CHAT domain-containing protein [Balneolaceae bacterium]|nr:CHAT domain-containing protein [Balneolaceae bacterium]